MQRAILFIIAGTLLSTVWVAHAFTFCSQFRLETRRFQQPSYHRHKQAFFAAKEEDITFPPRNNTAVSYLANDADLSTLTKNNPTWNQNIAALLEFNQTHGTVNLPALSKKYPNLGQWVYNLRKYKGRLTKEQIQQLNDIGFLWKEAKMDKNDKKWHEMFMRLQEYKDQHGVCLVPKNYDNGLVPKLGYWVFNQRKLYTNGKIRKDREDMLDSIGFVWRLRDFYERERRDYEKLWEKRYEELIDFKEEHNHTHVPFNSPPNKALGIWVNDQRMKKKDGTLRKDRIPLLDQIGFTWDFDQIYNDSWLEHYEELKTYYQELTSYNEMMANSPEGSEAATRPVLSEALGRWAAEQRRRHAQGNLDSDRKSMLDDIGFDWWST